MDPTVVMSSHMSAIMSANHLHKHRAWNHWLPFVKRNCLHQITKFIDTKIQNVKS